MIQGLENTTGGLAVPVLKDYRKKLNKVRAKKILPTDFVGQTGVQSKVMTSLKTKVKESGTHTERSRCSTTFYPVTGGFGRSGVL